MRIRQVQQDGAREHEWEYHLRIRYQQVREPQRALGRKGRLLLDPRNGQTRVLLRPQYHPQQPRLDAAHRPHGLDGREPHRQLHQGEHGLPYLTPPALVDLAPLPAQLPEQLLLGDVRPQVARLPHGFLAQHMLPRLHDGRERRLPVDLAAGVDGDGEDAGRADGKRRERESVDPGETGRGMKALDQGVRCSDAGFEEWGSWRSVKGAVRSGQSEEDAGEVVRRWEGEGAFGAEQRRCRHGG